MSDAADDLGVGAAEKAQRWGETLDHAKARLLATKNADDADHAKRLDEISKEITKRLGPPKPMGAP